MTDRPQTGRSGDTCLCEQYIRTQEAAQLKNQKKTLPELKLTLETVFLQVLSERCVHLTSCPDRVY